MKKLKARRSDTTSATASLAAAAEDVRKSIYAETNLFDVVETALKEKSYSVPHYGVPMREWKPYIERVLARLPVAGELDADQLKQEIVRLKQEIIRRDKIVAQYKKEHELMHPILEYARVALICESDSDDVVFDKFYREIKKAVLLCDSIK